LVGDGSGDDRVRHHLRIGQLHHHDPDHAHARYDDVPHADLHLEHPADLALGPDGLPCARLGAVRARLGPYPGLATLRCGERGSDAVATLVLVLRTSRGLYHRLAVLRDHHRDPAGLLPQTGVRLPGPGDRDDLHRRTVNHGAGAPHVLHRASATPVLCGDDHADRR